MTTSRNMNMKLAISLSLAFFTGTASAGPPATTCQGACARHASTYEEYKQCVDYLCKNDLLSADSKEVDGSFVEAGTASANTCAGSCARHASTYEEYKQCVDYLCKNDLLSTNSKEIDEPVDTGVEQDESSIEASEAEKSVEITSIPNCEEYCEDAYSAQQNIEACKRVLCPSCNEYCENAYMTYSDDDVKYILIDACIDNYCKDGSLSIDSKEVEESFVGGTAASDLVPLPGSGIFECQRRCDQESADDNERWNCYDRCRHPEDNDVSFVELEGKNDQCTEVLTRLCREEHQSHEDIRQCVEDVCGPSKELAAVVEETQVSSKTNLRGVSFV